MCVCVCVCVCVYIPFFIPIQFGDDDTPVKMHDAPPQEAPPPLRLSREQPEESAHDVPPQEEQQQQPQPPPEATEGATATAAEASDVVDPGTAIPTVRHDTINTNTVTHSM